MEIIGELRQTQLDELLSEVAGLHDRWHIEESLCKRHRYRVQIYDADFDTILINSSMQERDLDLSEYPPLREVIDSIAKEAAFLSKENRFGKLNGIRVRTLYTEFVVSGGKPRQFFIVDRDFYPGMNPRGLFYVRDGMHRLVAYGLATQMNRNAFPITGYYSTNKENGT